MKPPEFVALAPCAEADPWLFDQHHIHLAMPALNHCSHCPFWKECDEWVEPAKYFYDGVVSGKVWRNGKILARLDESSPNRLLLGESEIEIGTSENTDAVEL